MDEIKYFFEDHWLKVVIGVVVIGLLAYFMFGLGGNDESGNEEGLITDDEYNNSIEEGTEESNEEGTNIGDNDEPVSNEEVETEGDSEGNTDSGNGETSNGNTGEGSTEDEDVEEDVEVIEYEDETVDYGEDTEFNITDDLLVSGNTYTNDNLNTIVNEYEVSDVEREDDLMVEMGKYRFFGSNVSECYNDEAEYESCVNGILAELKWEDSNEEIEESFDAMGTYLANQNYVLEGMKELVSEEEDNDNLVKVMDALELELMIRADILKDLQTMGDSGLSEEEKGDLEYKVTSKLSQLVELEDFVDNYWNQRMGLEGTE